jgi:hypothetical protein
LLARIGLESEPVFMEASGGVFGDARNVTARVQAAAFSAGMDRGKSPTGDSNRPNIGFVLPSCY